MGTLNVEVRRAWKRMEAILSELSEEPADHVNGVINTKAIT